MLSPAPDPALALDVLRLRVAAGAPTGEVTGLPPRARRAVAVATAVGAPLLDAIDGARAAEDDASRARRAVAVASAQTRAVAGGLLLAPMLLVPGLGRLVGADLGAFYTSGPGLVVLAAGSGLLALGAGVIVVLVRRVGRPPSAGMDRRAAAPVAVAAALILWPLLGMVVASLAGVGLHRLLRRRRDVATAVGTDEAADLVATALSGSVGVPEALRLAARELPDLADGLTRLAFHLEFGLAVDASGSSRVDEGGPTASFGFARLARVVAAAEELGAALAPTLRHLAREVRADDLARVLAAAERLPAQLTFPTALCLLPATVLLVGAPIVHAGLVAAGT